MNVRESYFCALAQGTLVSVGYHPELTTDHLGSTCETAATSVITR